MASSGIVSRLLYLGHRLRHRDPRAADGPATDEALAADDTDVPTPRPDGLVVWMHSSDAADAAALPALVQELARLRGEPVHGLLTFAGGTPPQNLRDGIITRKAPTEHPQAIADFLDHCRPDICVCQGLPDRPRLFDAAKSRNIPMYLTAPRRGLAARSLPMLAASLIDSFDVCLAPSGADARLLRARTRDPDKVLTTGPMSDTGVALPCNETELADFSADLASRPVWLALRPTAPEIALIETAHREAARSAHRLLLICAVPPGEDGARIAETFEAAGWRTARRSLDEPPLAEVQVYIADGTNAAQDEELWFRLAPIVFLGGTLSGGDATDPYRPAAHGAAIVAGPDDAPMTARFARLDEASAIRRIDTSDTLGAAITSLLAPDLAAKLALAGWSVTSDAAHVIDRLARLMDEALDRLEEA